MGMSADIESGLYDQATVRLRYGEEEALNAVLSESTDGEALLFNNAHNVVKDLLRVETFLFGFTPFNSNPTSATFDVRGLAGAPHNVTELCPLQ
jgi:hypothetical protein